MARPLRLEFPTLLYCVAARGKARAAIYHGDADRAAFLDLHAEAAARFAWRCPAFRMTANRDHWAAGTPEPNPSR